MVFIKDQRTKNKQAQQTIYILDNEESFKRYLAFKKENDAKPSRMSRDAVKLYLRDFLKDNQQLLKNKFIHVTYLTSEGNVDLNRNVITEDGLTNQQLEALMADPKENAHMASGEYNNTLAHKTLYGVAISIFKHSAVKPKSKGPGSKYKPNFAQPVAA